MPVRLWPFSCVPLGSSKNAAVVSPGQENCAVFVPPMMPET